MLVVLGVLPVDGFPVHPLLPTPQHHAEKQWTPRCAAKMHVIRGVPGHAIISNYQSLHHEHMARAAAQLTP